MDRLDDEIEQVAERVIGAAIEVHRRIGPGHPESVCSNALGVELGLCGFACAREFGNRVQYKGKVAGGGRIDFLVSKRLVIEIKAVELLRDVHASQVVAYLSQVNEPVGILINFNLAVLKKGLKRVI